MQSRRSSAVLSACLAYALALQALMASVGIGMSAFATPEPAGFVICSHTATGAPAGDNDRQKPAPACQFCFVAAQCAGHMAFTAETPAFPAYTAVLAARITDLVRDGAFVPRFRRFAGDPRAPPAFSV
ncbi:MAG: DUF2946 family protein [Xanthobacteraceae bacterium]